MIVGMGILALSLVEASLALLVIGGVVASFGQGISLRAESTGLRRSTPRSSSSDASRCHCP